MGKEICFNCRGAGSSRISQHGGGYTEIACPACGGTGYTSTGTGGGGGPGPTGGMGSGGISINLEHLIWLTSFLFASFIINLWVIGLYATFVKTTIFSVPVPAILGLSILFAIPVMLFDIITRAFIVALFSGVLLGVVFYLLERNVISLPLAMEITLFAPPVVGLISMVARWPSRIVGLHAASFLFLSLGALINVAIGYQRTDGSGRDIAYYAFESAKSSVSYYFNGGPYASSRTMADQVIICEPAHFNTATHEEIAAPSHLEAMYARMEQNLHQQITNRSGELYALIDIALRNYEYPIVLLHRLPPGSSYDYDYRVIGQKYKVNQDCSRLTPQQNTGIVARQRGTGIPASIFR
jgi:hypothetical protein